MKNVIILLFLVYSSFAFELSFDTINTSETKVLYVNSGSDSVRFDSARVDMIKSKNNQCEIILICFFTDNITGEPTREFATPFAFSNYGEYGEGDSINFFRPECRPGESVSLTLESFDYRLIAIIPENGPAPLNPPEPIQAKMVFFTNKGNDSIIINGMQTNQPALNAVVNRQAFLGKIKAGQTKYYTINGKQVNLSSTKRTTLPNGIGITLEKYPDGSIVCKKNLQTH